jgi:transcriptional regulator with PAS, ATPase and Fis domain
LIHTRLESLIDEMLDGHILLDEAICEFEKLYIKKALARHKQHLSKTAVVLGIHRNTLAKRVATYKGVPSSRNGTRKQKTRVHSR